MTAADLRSQCKEKIESLEHWLRRLIDSSLTPVYGDYFSHVTASGDRLIKKSLADQVADRCSHEPNRYPRPIDAVLLEDAIRIVCHPDLYKNHFKDALSYAFPDGREEAKTFMERLLLPRNHLAHANPISARQAEQILCYSNDVIDSLKEFYRSIGMNEAYNVPTILKVTDSFGNCYTRSQCSTVHDGGISKSFTDKLEMFLRPGDLLTLEIEVDPAFDPDSYTIRWASTKQWESSSLSESVVHIPISNKQVGQGFDVQCHVTSTKDWHRMHMGCDDFLMFHYKVLPPTSQA